MGETRKSRNKKKSKHIVLKVFAALILLIGIGVGTYMYSIYHNAKQTVNKQMHKTVEAIDTAVTKKKIKKTKPLNILLMGVDKRPGDSGRSDALMVLSLDPKKDAMKLISIPRDTRTLIAGKGFEDKINHAYAFGGPDMSINTVEHLLDIDVDYYVEINMQGLSSLVDSLGGITVNNELDWYDEGIYKKGYHYKKGMITLDGAKTMGFVRMRHADPNGDFGRTERQRKVIEGIINKGASIGSVTKINDMIHVLGKNMATTMDFSAMKSLLLGYKDTRKNITTYMLKGSGTRINGIYYLIVPNEEIEKAHDMITGA